MCSFVNWQAQIILDRLERYSKENFADFLEARGKFVYHMALTIEQGQ